jgi:AraC-like DNA-binding protein
MSRTSLYSKLLELTGQSPVEYIRSFRLEKAAALMEKSNMNIAEIAYQVGFTTPNYFARSFKGKYNMLPSEFIAIKRQK